MRTSLNRFKRFDRRSAGTGSLELPVSMKALVGTSAAEALADGFASGFRSARIAA